MRYTIECTEEETKILEEWSKQAGLDTENCIREALRRAGERPCDGVGLMVVADRIQEMHRDVQMQLMSCHREGRDLCDGCRMLMALLKDVRGVLADVKRISFEDRRFSWRST